MEFANSSTSPRAKFCRDPDGFTLFGAIETFLDIDIDVRLVLGALEELLERLSYCLFIVVLLGSINVGEAGLESGDDLGG